MKARFFCENCGTEVSYKALRCPSCGKFFSAVSCPSCGFQGKADNFLYGCPMCGYLVGGGIQRKTPGARERAQTEYPPRRVSHRLPRWFYRLAGIVLSALLIALIALLLLLNK
jgi:uncharacterized membrane protein YvbJ